MVVYKTLNISVQKWTWINIYHQAIRRTWKYIKRNGRWMTTVRLMSGGENQRKRWHVNVWNWHDRTAQGTWMEKKVSTGRCKVSVSCRWKPAFRGTLGVREEKDFRTCWVLYEKKIHAEFGNGMSWPLTESILIWHLSVTPFPGLTSPKQ